MSYRIPTYSNWPTDIPNASTTSDGLMSAADKAKLDSLTAFQIASGGVTFPAEPLLNLNRSFSASDVPGVQTDVNGTSWVNVKNPAFGAIGNGIADDAPAIQAAISALIGPGSTERGGTVYFPAGTYNIASQGIGGTGVGLLIVPNALTGFEFINLVGDGSGNTIIRSVAPVPYVDMIFASNLNILRIQNILFANDFNPTAGDYLSLLANCVEIHSCRFQDMLTAAGAGVRLRGNFNRMINCFINGGFVPDGIITITDGGALIQDCMFTDGALNGSPAWIKVMPSVAPRFDSVGTHPVRIDECGFDEAAGGLAVLGLPVGAVRGSNIVMSNCNVFTNPGVGMIDITNFERVTIDNCGSKQRRAFHDTMTFTGCTNVTIRNFQRTQEPDGIGGLGQVIIGADATNGLLRIIDSQIDGLNVLCPAVIEQDSITAYVVPGTTVGSNLFLKPDPITAGLFVVAAAGDAPSNVIGVSVAGTAVATSGPLAMPAPGAIPNQSTWTITGNMPTTTLFQFEFRNDGQPASPGMILVDISAAANPTDVAVAFRTAINATTGVGFSVTSTNLAGVITIFSTFEGAEGDHYFVLSAAFTGLGAVGIIGGSAVVQVGRISGQIYQVQSDGAGAINPGDPITLSAAVGADGQAVLAAAGNICGRAVSAAPAVPGALISFVFSKEAI